MLEDAANPPASQCKMHLDAAELSSSDHREIYKKLPKHAKKDVNVAFIASHSSTDVFIANERSKTALGESCSEQVKHLFWCE